MDEQSAGKTDTSLDPNIEDNELSTVSVPELTDYITHIVAALVGETNDSLIKEPLDTASESLEKFITDQQSPIFVVNRLTQNDDSSDKITVCYTAINELHYNKDQTLAAVFVKKSGTIVADKPLCEQLSVSLLNSSDPYDSICTHIGSVLAPYFKSVVHGKFRDKQESDKLIPSIEKNLNDAEVALLHLKQNIDIPEVELVINPKIQVVVDKAKASQKQANVADLGNDVNDPAFLNILQAGVNRWTSDIQKVTKLDRNPESGTSMQEVAFWLNLENALKKIEQQCESEGVRLTLDVLNHAKRFHATASFTSNAGLKERIQTANNYNQFMRDLPLNDLISATDIDSIQKALSQVLLGMKKVRNTKYPVNRVNAFLHALSADAVKQFLKVLQAHRLLAIPKNEFDQIIRKTTQAISKLDPDFETILNYVRDKKKRDESNLKPLKLRTTQLPHKALETRLDSIQKFRNQHDQLSSVIQRVVRVTEVGTPSDGIDPLKEIAIAYESVKEVECLDLSPEGEQVWAQANRFYNERIARVETHLATQFREQLASTRSAEEMFKIFSRYNLLFYRNNIKSTIREYQTKLIERVKEDIQNLQNIFEDPECQRRAIAFTMGADMPEIACRIVWNHQILKQLDFCMKRVADVLGEDWANYKDGMDLKKEDDRFRQKLNTDTLYNEWVAILNNYNAPTNARMLLIEKQQRDGRQQLCLKVNFAPELIELCKASRTIRSMGMRPPFRILNSAHQTSNIYPYAISLIQSVRDYQITHSMVAERPGAEMLVASLRKDLHIALLATAPFTWDSFKTETLVVKVADASTNYQDKVYDLMEILDKIDSDVKALDSCPYNRDVISNHLQSIQKNVDQLSYGSYSNQVAWTESLSNKIEKILAIRVERAIALWTRYLTINPEEIEEPWDGEIRSIRLALRITSQTMTVHPSIENATTSLLNQLFAFHGIISKQPRIVANRHQATLRTEEDLTYKSAILNMPNQMKVMFDAFRAVTSVMDKVSAYVKEWVRYQVLWDLQAEFVSDRLENDLDKWIRALIEIRNTRKQLEDSQSIGMKSFPVFVDYTEVQNKVAAKYDFWQREIQQRFINVLGESIKNFYNEIAKFRPELETQSLDSSATSDAIALITAVQNLKKRFDLYESQVSQFHVGERLLTSARHPMPNSWIFAEHVAGEWSALKELLERKDAAIKARIASLQSRIKDEDDVVERRIVEVLDDWGKDKPTHGNRRPRDAIQVLSTYEDRFTKIREDRENMVRAKNALDMTDTLRVGTQVSKLDVAMEELADLRGAWQALMPIYDEIDELREKSWVMVQPRKLRQSVDDLLASLKKLPSQFRSYESYEQTKRLLQNYSRMNALISELKSEALKERHWERLTRELRVSWNQSDLTLGQVWEIDLIRHESVIRQMLLVAQGELALELFLKQVKEYWTAYTVDLVNYQSKTMLIRGWDDLFNKLKEHINSLAAMKLSPYYKEFEEDAISWEDRLNKINALFDVWIDVQRRWVYLEGLFSGSADIATLLPMESNRFFGVSNEFLALMKRVNQSPRILEVVHIQGAQRLLERLADILAKIQKALGEYLERERSSFPRFYFVGDEDLLEIMGNSKDLVRIQKHLKKMFAGIMAIEVEEEKRLITAIVSREGETVQLETPVDLNAIPKINDWLRKLEEEMQKTLAKMLHRAIDHFNKFDITTLKMDDFMQWMDLYPAQVVSLAADVWWSTLTDAKLAEGKKADGVLELVTKTLALLSDSVLQDQPSIRRKKIENMITEFVHKRDVTRKLVSKKVSSNTDFYWLEVMRFYFDKNQTKDPTKCCIIRMANAQFYYGFEYLGIQERLVQTPLTDRCFLTMTQALHSRLGGSPFGPAGTGKTESVKALGHQLGRFVLVFNCDETFDFQAVGRILVGLCQVGAWGCFDEFNRLEERMLSAVSQQIQTIQEAVRAGGNMSVNLVGKNLNVNSNMAIFITMNPGYSGRSNLPDNLKQLFRSLAMTQPDRNLIAQVMLFSQGFGTAETLAKKIVPLFTLCKEQLSNQSHYDFGLRALKYVLVSAGNIKRDDLQQGLSSGDADVNTAEQQILIRSVCETLVPKLVSEDITLLFSLLQDVFPDIPYKPKENVALRTELIKVCDKLHLTYSDASDQSGYQWMEKVLQLYQITNLNHGLMLVGASGCGKTMAWKVLLKALENMEQKEGVAHVIDAKAMSKDSLYGVLDPNTREWTDGLFTSIVRKIIDNVRGEADKRQWIIFDGDVDPEWVENLNSVLDDNKLLTLPNGERLAIPPNVRIIFEVADLRYATLATVSRCGMVWFSENVITTEMLFDNYLARLRNLSIENDAKTSVDDLLASMTNKSTVDAMQSSMMPAVGQSLEASTTTMSASLTTSTLGTSANSANSRNMHIQNVCAYALSDHFSSDGMVPRSLEFSLTNVDHIMEVSRQRLLLAFFSMMNYSVRQLLNYSFMHQDFPLTDDQVSTYISRAMLVNMIWSFSGDGKWKCRQKLSDFIRGSTTIPLPTDEQVPIIDFEVVIEGGEVNWMPWSRKVPRMEIETHRIASGDVVVPTMDTVRHELLLNIWLNERKPLVLTGPPGSGKTMTLLSALRSQPDIDLINVNFSSSTTPELLMKAFDHYCEYRRTPNGLVLAPVQLGRWLVIFCDEINLPKPDKYGTQRVISFLRQLVSQNGFYRPSDQQWITLERIQFVGASNPPNDPGRHHLAERFLRHVPVIYVDYPGQSSLSQIYSTFNRAILRQFNHLSGYADSLTEAMVEVYLRSQERFTQDDQPHYIYSPRELSRWVKGVSEAISPLDTLDLPDLVRLWAHEGLRLFQDRLIYDHERKWTDDLIDETARKFFGSQIDVAETLKRPILYSCWLTKNYTQVSREELQKYVEARIRNFCEEELDVKLVLFDQLLEHVLRIDRIFRQPQGHLLLIGVSGVGKTTLSRFVAWLNGLEIFQLKVHSKYTGENFDEDIRHVLRRAGCKGEKICFIIDESNMLDSGFLERLNTLLANGEVPGLFEGDELNQLMNQVKENAQRQGLMLDSSDELYKFFTNEVIRNLHIVFTMGMKESGLGEQAATSPALFNRCVLDFFGDWSSNSLYQCGLQLTHNLDMARTGYEPPMSLSRCCDLVGENVSYQEAVINSFVHFHETVRRLIESEKKKNHQTLTLSPRHFLDFISHYTKLHHEKRDELEDEQRHLNTGLQKISETEEQVKELQKSLTIKSKELEEKKQAANAKLKQMMDNQQKAENEKVLSEKLRKEMESDLIEIGKKKALVGDELAQVEPAVEEAKQAVKGIKKQQLTELRSMTSPPPLVKLTLEAVCTLLGEEAIDWKAIRTIMVQEGFITKILTFDSENVRPEILQAIKKYVENSDLEFEKVNRASVACGPLVLWVKSQILYSSILNKVEPLRLELDRLKNDAEAKNAKCEELDNAIKQLETDIGVYKDEYAQLVSETEKIKADLSTVQDKVQRSVHLIQNLNSEAKRWESSKQSFASRYDTLVGDNSVASAFLSYGGFFDSRIRSSLIQRWTHILQDARIETRFR